MKKDARKYVRHQYLWGRTSTKSSVKAISEQAQTGVLDAGRLCLTVVVHKVGRKTMRRWLKRRKFDRRSSVSRKNGQITTRQLTVEVLDVRLPLAITTELVKDINVIPDPQSSHPNEFEQVGGTLLQSS
ncbi:MAG: hypothetical protein U0930_24025 [Pirellulales bacterium]